MTTGEAGEARDGLAYMPFLTDEEIDEAIRAMPDERLTANYQRAAKSPGTEWLRLLSAEIGRRDALGGKR